MAQLQKDLQALQPIFTLTLPYHLSIITPPYLSPSPSPYPSSMLSGGNDGTITKRSASIAAFWSVP